MKMRKKTQGRQCVEDKYKEELVAIDWYPGGPNLPNCYCQNACKCMVDNDSATTITRDSAVDALPEPCNDDDDTSYGGYDDVPRL